jgi:Tfp pilus assembly protein PilF
VQEEESTSSPLVTAAEQAIDKQDYATAEAKLKEATASDPKDYQAWFYLGYVYDRTQHVDLAQDAYQHAVNAKPEVFESNLNLGLVLAAKKDPAAEKYLSAATQLKPLTKPNDGHARAWLALAHFLENSKPESALVAYGEAAKLRPVDAEPHLGAALILGREGKYPEAEAEYRRASELDPKSSDALTGLVTVALEQKHYDQAEALLKKQLAADPNDAAAHTQMGRVLAAEGKYPEATTELEAGLVASPNDPAAMRELAAIYAAAKQWDKAMPLYAKLVQAQPRDAELRHMVGVALINQHKFPEAEQQLVTSANLDRSRSAVYGDLAVAAGEAHDYQMVIKALDARAQYLPETPATYFLRATAYDNLHLFKEASEFYKRFLQSAGGQLPDQEWQARHRLKAIDPKSR